MVLILACRETAFIHAITSAGVTFAITENCARGFIKRCHCASEKLKRSRRNSNNWIYAGCQDNIRYGYIKGKMFVDAKETSQDFKSIVNLHNNEAGRLVRHYFCSRSVSQTGGVKFEVDLLINMN